LTLFFLPHFYRQKKQKARLTNRLYFSKNGSD
jgi:hypothetical protein